jgi:hypothetical protein
MRIWHWTAIVLLAAPLLAVCRDRESLLIFVFVGGMAPGVAMVVACGLALGRLAHNHSRCANLAAWLLCAAIVLAPLGSAIFSFVLMVKVEGMLSGLGWSR